MSRNPVNDGYTNPEKEAEIHRSNQQRERDQQTPELKRENKFEGLPDR